MRWLVVAFVLLVPSVTFAAAPFRLELGGSVGLASGDPDRAPAGVRVGVLHQRWSHVGFGFDLHHFFLDGPLQGRYGLYSYDAGMLSVRVSGGVGPVRLFLAPGLGLACGHYITGDIPSYDRLELGLGFGLRTGLEVLLGEHFVVGTAAHFLISSLDMEYGPEGNLGVELYGAYRF